MHSRWNGNFKLTSLHELKQGHLSRGILHGNTVRSKVHIGIAAFKNLIGLRIPQVSVEYFLCKGQWMSQQLPRLSHLLRVSLVKVADHVNVKCHSSMFYAYKNRSQFADASTRPCWQDNPP